MYHLYIGKVSFKARKNIDPSLLKIAGQNMAQVLPDVQIRRQKTALLMFIARQMKSVKSKVTVITNEGEG